MERLLKCCALMAAVFALVELALLFHAAKTELPKIRPAVIAEVDAQASGIRSDAMNLLNTRMDRLEALSQNELKDARLLVSAELQQTRQLVSEELGKTRADARQSIGDLSRTADNRLLSIQTDLVGQISRTESDLNSRISEIHESVNSSLEPLNSTLQQVSDASALFLDCDHNADCLFNRYVGTARGTEKTAEAIGKIASDISTLTHEFTKPKPWYKHLADYFKVGIYGAANLIK